MSFLTGKTYFTNSMSAQLPWLNEPTWCTSFQCAGFCVSCSSIGCMCQLSLAGPGNPTRPLDNNIHNNTCMIAAQPAIFLLDAENGATACPKELRPGDIVVIVYSEPQERRVTALKETVESHYALCRLRKVAVREKNGADHVLSMAFGRLIEQYPRSHFVVISSDKAFNAALQAAHEDGISCERRDVHVTAQTLPPKKSKKTAAGRAHSNSPLPHPGTAASDAVAKACQRILAVFRKSSPPRTLPRLYNAVRALLGTDAPLEQVTQCVDWMRQHGHVTIDRNQRIIYAWEQAPCAPHACVAFSATEWALANSSAVRM
ncbi:MAG: hypothetical protein KatS3mg110_1135 [Pirellulaceae bacterium]|nr:MAG: hypothetical protein KatS3mg110_1135 [Pirellulaceae bacterium]